ncbi:hypothetical protein GE061_001804 [Apolygus lucorum]|uniref:Elongation of very long chain fatty acids protein n=1 Tax=Apolygus lucorum TaxID=248454 RepID=A0A6A4JGJ3_APOLU|nr:hypothetical protein GE061_001804 [Apolygus lucorum]
MGESLLSRYNKTLFKAEEDALLRSWGHVARPAHVYWVIAIYVAAVYFGPKFMKNRKAFVLKEVIMCYNVFQVLMNGYVVVLYYKLFGPQALRWWENLCCPVSAAQNFRPLVQLEYMEALRIFYINKLLDLIDTLFFILRKKQNQITFLHVYHHVNMVITTFCSAMIFREEMSMMFATLNSVTHVVMYSYYFLAACGPSVQKYLWWKKYITSIQILQFLVGLAMLLISKSQGCPIDNKFFTMWVVNISIFLGMFLRFYAKTYRKKPTSLKD